MKKSPDEKRTKVGPARYSLAELRAIGRYRHPDELPEEFMRRCILREIQGRGGHTNLTGSIDYWAKAGARDAFRGFPAKARREQQMPLRQQTRAVEETARLSCRLLDCKVALEPPAQPFGALFWSFDDSRELRAVDHRVLDLVTYFVPKPATVGGVCVAIGSWAPPVERAASSWCFPGVGILSVYTPASLGIPRASYTFKAPPRCKFGLYSRLSHEGGPLRPLDDLSPGMKEEPGCILGLRWINDGGPRWFRFPR